MRHRSLTLFTATGLAVVALAGCGGSEEAGGSVEAFCAMESRVDEMESLDPTTEEGMAQASELFDELEAAAPPEISDDVATIGDMFEELGGMSAEEMTEMDADELTAMMADVDTAGSNVEAFIAENCG